MSNKFIMVIGEMLVEVQARVEIPGDWDTEALTDEQTKFIHEKANKPFSESPVKWHGVKELPPVWSNFEEEDDGDEN